MTLILSRCRNLEVMDAFLDGIDLARATGQDLSRIAAVASMFVSRVDAEIDRRDRPGRGECPARHGRDGHTRPAFQAVEVMAALSGTAASPTTTGCTSSNATAQ